MTRQHAYENKHSRSAHASGNRKDRLGSADDTLQEQDTHPMPFHSHYL